MITKRGETKITSQFNQAIDSTTNRSIRRINAFFRYAALKYDAAHLTECVRR